MRWDLVPDVISWSFSYDDKISRRVIELGNARIDFLLAECELAMTFLDVADASDTEKTVQRNWQNARTAYETVIRFLPNVTLTAIKRGIFRIGYQGLRNVWNPVVTVNSGILSKLYSIPRLIEYT